MPCISLFHLPTPAGLCGWQAMKDLSLAAQSALQSKGTTSSFWYDFSIMLHPKLFKSLEKCPTSSPMHFLKSLKVTVKHSNQFWCSISCCCSAPVEDRAACRGKRCTAQTAYHSGYFQKPVQEKLQTEEGNALLFPPTFSVSACLFMKIWASIQLKVADFCHSFQWE